MTCEYLAAIISHIMLLSKLLQSEDASLTETEDAILRLVREVALAT